MTISMRLLDLAAEVLRNKDGLTPLEMWGLIQKVFPDEVQGFRGKTPHRSLGSALYVDIKQNADSSKFKKVAPDRFSLR